MSVPQNNENESETVTVTTSAHQESANESITDVAEQNNDDNAADRRPSFFDVGDLNYEKVSLYLLLFANTFCFVFAGLGYYIMYCQLLDQKSINPGVLTMDVELAQQLIATPETITPCLEEFQSACAEQYIYATFFGILSTYLVGKAFLPLIANLAPSSMTDNSTLSKFKVSARVSQDSRRIHPEELGKTINRRFYKIL